MSSGPTPGIGPQDLAPVVARNPRDRPVLVVHVGARLAHAPGYAADQHQRMAPVPRTVGAGDDDGRGVVGLDAAVEQMQRLADDAAVDHVLHRHALLVIGLGVVGGMPAVGHAYGRHLLRRRAVVVHVAHEAGAEQLPRALPAVGAVVQHVARDRGRRARAGAADAHLGKAVHGAEDDDSLAHAGLDHADGDADQGLGGGAAAEHVHMEIEADAEIAGDERTERWSRPTDRTACRRHRKP